MVNNRLKWAIDRAFNRSWLNIQMVLVLLLLVSQPGFASVRQQSQVIELNEVTLKEAFKEIKMKTGYSFVYNDKVLNDVGPVSFVIDSEDINTIMDKCLANTSLKYYVQNQVVVVMAGEKTESLKASQSSVKLQGVVLDKSKQPLPGVTVILRGTTLGTATDIDGKFTLTIPAVENIVLEFSFIGMKKKEVSVKASGELINVPAVIMEDEEAELEEVVVTGIFARQKEGFTGSAVTVKGDDLKKVSATNIAKALATLDPGFRVMDDILNGSDPNRLPDMRMRGQATLPPGASSSDVVSMQGEYDTYPNQPLLILDGLEIDVQTFADLDPDRVASATILKDAAATAIYGSRAANGVIVIETLAPMPGTIHVTYGGNVRVEAPDLSAYNLMNAQEKIEVELLAGLYPKSDLSALQDYESRLRAVKQGVDTYWLSQPLKTAVQQRHSVTLEGGDTALRYKLYVGLNNTPGVMKGSKRNTQTATLDLSYRVNKFLMKNSVTVNNAVGENSPYGSFREYTMLNPYLRPYGENGEIQKIMQTWNMRYSGGGEPEPVANPMYNATFHSLDRTSNFTIRDLFKLEYNPTSALRFQADISLEKGIGKNELFRPAQHTKFQNVIDPMLRGEFKRRQSERFTYAVDLTGSFNKSFNGVHTVTANMRFSVREDKDESYQTSMTGFPNDNMDHILFGKVYGENMTGSEETVRSISGVGTFGYSYNYKYSVDFNIRIDGSSQFGSNNRFAPFWSAGVRWNMKKENLFANLEWMDDIVWRMSYGITGTQGFPAYQAQQVYSYSNLMRPYLASDGTGVELVALGNTNLKWQQTGTWNIALEASLWEGRFTTRAEYFLKKTRNSLAQITLAPSLGFATYPENLGNIENKGVELNFSFIPYRDRAKQAFWVISVNGSHNKDKIVKISDALRQMNEKNNANTTDTPLPQYVEGESLTNIWAVRSLGIDPATGEEIFLKRNGVITSKYDAVDRVPVGNTEPKWQGNINTNFSYRGFGVNLSFNYKFGGQTYNTTLVDKIENVDIRKNVDKRVLDLRWKNPGDIAKYKKLTNSINGSATSTTSRFVMDENTFRFGSLSLSYRMEGADSAFLKKLAISSMKWSFNMEDLFYLSTVKQERGLDYPFARQFSLSLNLVF